MAKYIVFSHSDENTKELANSIASQILCGHVLALEGELGVGKTTFAKGFAKGLGITEVVDSPTFNIIKEYQGTDFIFFHIDLYRINSSDDVLLLEDYLYRDGICLIEWASRVNNFLSEEHTTFINISVINENKRKIEITTPLSLPFRSV